MNYQDALAYLADISTFGMKLGLQRIERLLALMQHPEQRFKSIHVAGTNGKGSVAVMLASILQTSDVKTGLYISPHLLDYTERITVNGQEISPSAFAEAVGYTSRFADRMATQGEEYPTEFEVLTAAAFYYFAAAGVEYAVIEAGLGGLLDSTNVLVPEVSIITNVTLEHTAQCGGTIAEIAAHKAGIIKRGVPVVTAAKAEALAVLEAKAEQEHAAIFVCGHDFSGQCEEISRQGQTISVADPCSAEPPAVFPLRLLGYQQVENGAVAVTAARLVGRKDSRITVQSIAAGLAEARWPGRFELISQEPLILVDGAHNPDGARMLRYNLEQIFPDRRYVFLLGILRDKDIDGIIQALIRSDDQVVTVAPLSERAVRPEELAGRIQAAHVDSAAAIEAGLDKALSLLPAGGVLCVAGSLYLIGAVRPLLLR